jgi:Helix-turn-helix domain
MQKIYFDPYVLDVLMPDLVGHDKRPAAFVVYLFLLTASSRSKRDVVGASLQTISSKTGLSKSTVQNALRHLRHRGLIDSELVATSAQPLRRVLRPWIR